MENENSKRNDSVFSRKIRAGRRRTYFFDVRTTRANDYYLTITESKKRFDGEGYERHKLFIYKEDFNKFVDELGQVVDHIKGLMPDFDFDAFAHKYDEQTGREGGVENHHDAGNDNMTTDNSNDAGPDEQMNDNSGHIDESRDAGDPDNSESTNVDDDDLKL